MKKQKVAIIGAGGFAREVLDIFDAINAVSKRFEVLGFVIDPQYGQPGTIVNGKPILGGFDWFEGREGEVQTLCAVGSPSDRMKMTERATKMGIGLVNAVHPSAIMTRRVTLGKGVVIGAGSILTNNITIGDNVHINLSCTVGHDAVIERYVTISPGTNISGRVSISEGSFIGTNTSINERIRVGKWSVIGSGSVIIKDVPENSTVVGNPGKIVKTREPGWHLA